MLLIRRLEKYVNIPVDVDVCFYFGKYKIEEGNFEMSLKVYLTLFQMHAFVNVFFISLSKTFNFKL